MKRRNLDDYFTPVKKVKPSSCAMCKDCGDMVDSNSTSFHDCLREVPKKKILVPMPDIFKKIMSTPQSTIKSNFHLDYLGKTDKHNWAYSFADPTLQVYKSKVHKLKLTSKSLQEIQLTFTTSHQGSPVHFFDVIPMPSFSPSILKSLLHKAIRRGLQRQSLKTSLQLACNCG